MSHKNRSCLYDKDNVIPIYEKNGQMEERNLNISVVNIEDVLQIKIRDPLEYSFNFTENIDLADFEIMRLNQNLDINFNEFKSNLIEMLEQFQKKEMFLKCETTNQKCTLVFYGKSKIKSIVYLTVDLRITNQKEIFSELIGNMQQIQDSNDRLKKQLSNIRKILSERDQQIEQMNIKYSHIRAQFYKNLKMLDNHFNNKMVDIENLLLEKISFHSQRIGKLLEKVCTLKREIDLKTDSSTRLTKTMENLRIEAESNAALISQLKNENSALVSAKFCQEKNFAELRKVLQEKDTTIVDLQKKNEELRSDVEKAAIAISQKKATIDELSKDLVQANQMLVNFNNHYDTKSKQVEDLQGALATKEKIIKEQRVTANELLREFEGYKRHFNTETQEQLKHQLLLANNKIEELESSIRKANKINTLLTEKVNTQNLGFTNNK